MHNPFIVSPGSRIKLKDYDPKYNDNFLDRETIKKIKNIEPDFTGKLNKEIAKELLPYGIRQLAKYQDILYAQNTYALLIIFQAMDAAGKDSAIKHVMSGVNPQWCQVFSFKTPSAEELDHDYLWRSMKALPERGRVGIFNRSYYEEVLAVRVHPEILDKQQLPAEAKDKNIWQRRFTEINNFEQYLVANGIIILKFFLNVSQEEQKKRFLERIKLSEKNWKFSASDFQERAFWDDYMKAYEEVFNHTSTSWAPWHIIPAERKWYTSLAVAYLITDKLQKLNLKYPTVSKEQKQQLLKVKEMLENEK
ncbi:MAG: polyphosphate kinase 2 family protein [Pleurocapsa sp.]